MTLVDIMRKYKIDKVGYGMQPRKILIFQKSLKQSI